MKLSKIVRFNFVKTGSVIALISLIFIYDRKFFFYPPSLAPAWNDLWVDSIGLIAGLILIGCGIFKVKNSWLIKISLSVSAAFLALLITAELFHVVGIGYFRFHPIIIFEIYTVLNIMQIAYEVNFD